MLVACAEPEQTGDKAIKNSVISATESGVDKPPNILLIIVDDLGFSDLGVFGSEIQTPNIDALAHQGVLFTEFYSAPTCSPTRAMLLSGTDNHIAGLGSMAEVSVPNQVGRPGYEGYLNFRIGALPEVLSDAGYHTYMTGKWHLGMTKETSPAGRGFEKSFALLQGGAGAFANRLQLFGPKKAIYMEDGKELDSLPPDFYATRFYAQRMIEYIDSNRQDGKPFFSYLAFTAPHWPLQAPAASIKKYQGKYDQGYEMLRQKRLDALKKLGMVDATVEPYPAVAGQLPWEQLSPQQRQYEARKMEIYAAMVDDVDHYLGDVIDYLKTIGEYDNTLIFFMSDNGPEGADLARFWPGMTEFVESCCDNSYENMGNADSYLWYGPSWAQAGNPPRRTFKGYTSEGGINVPAFFHAPKLIASGDTHSAFAHVTDIMPTLLDAAGVEQPGPNYRGREIAPITGQSLLPVLLGQAQETHPDHHVTGWELFGRRAVRQGAWKLLFEPKPLGIGRWQLYNLNDDPAETKDLATQETAKLAEMISLWEDYERTNGVIIPDLEAMEINWPDSTEDNNTEDHSIGDNSTGD